MQGFLWLITQMALLLTAAAALFFWLGWRWGGASRAQPTPAQVEKASAPAAEPAPAASTATPATGDAAAAARLRAQVEEAEHHRRNLEKELIRVHEELKTARQDAAQHKQDAQAAKNEAARLSTELAGLRRENSRLEKQLATRPADAPEAPATKPARPKKSPAASARPRPALLDAAANLDRLSASLQAGRQLLAALQQERDDWQRRVTTLRESGKDAAGLSLAHKSLDRVEQQITETSASLQHLQQQEDALRRSQEAAATLGHEDDLTRIKGIKSVLRDQLHALGIKTFQQIAAWTEADTEAFGRLLGFKDRAKRDAWVTQAQKLLEKPEN